MLAECLKKVLEAKPAGKKTEAHPTWIGTIIKYRNRRGKQEKEIKRLTIYCRRWLIFLLALEKEVVNIVDIVYFWKLLFLSNLTPFLTLTMPDKLSHLFECNLFKY